MSNSDVVTLLAKVGTIFVSVITAAVVYRPAFVRAGGVAAYRWWRPIIGGVIVGITMVVVGALARIAVLSNAGVPMAFISLSGLIFLPILRGHAAEHWWSRSTKLFKPIMLAVAASWMAVMVGIATDLSALSAIGGIVFVLAGVGMMVELVTRWFTKP